MTYKGFVRSGANVPAEQQERFRQLNEQIASLTMRFAQNVLKATNAYSKELPDGSKVTLDMPTWEPFMQTCADRKLREEVWHAFTDRCKSGKYDNTKIIDTLVNLRLERANILGFPTHADWVLDDCLAKTPANVYKCLLDIWGPALKVAKQERDQYQRMLEQDEPGSKDLGFVRLYPAMGGGLDTADAEFDPERNRIYIAAVPCEEIRNALADRTASQGDDAKMQVIKVTWGDGEATNEIKSGEPFDIYFAGITLDVGDESAELALPDGTSVPVELDPYVPEDDALQRASGRLTQAVAACEGAKVVIHTHGPDRTSSLKAISSSKIEVLAGETPPEPGLTVTGVHNEETESPNIYVGRSLLFDGTGLDAWGDGDRIEVKRLGDGETDWESITGTDDVTVSAQDGMLWVSTDWWSAISFGVEDGIQIRFRVTIGGTSAETTGTVHED